MGRTGKAVSVKVSVHQLDPSHTFIEIDFIPSQLQSSLNGQAAKKAETAMAPASSDLFQIFVLKQRRNNFRIVIFSYQHF